MGLNAWPDTASARYQAGKPFVLPVLMLLTIPQAVGKFCQLADELLKVPDLTRGRQYADYKLKDAEGHILELICEVLKVCLFLTLPSQSSRHRL